MKVRDVIEALKRAPQGDDVVMADMMPVQSVDVDVEGHVIISDELQIEPPKTVTSTVTVKFALYGLNPKDLIEWLNTEVESGNELAGLTARIMWNDVDFNPNTADADAVCTARKLLDASFGGIDYNYDMLSSTEKMCVTKDEFDNLVEQFKLGQR